MWNPHTQICAQSYDFNYDAHNCVAQFISDSLGNFRNYPLFNPITDLAKKNATSVAHAMIRLVEKTS